MERVALKSKVNTRKPTKAKSVLRDGGAYFFEPKDENKFIRSGCRILDLALGGGWARRRVVNIVGDEAAGKTLLCIEACANFAIQEPNALIFYRETEEAFDPIYAEAIGMPLDRVNFGADPITTVEDLYEDLERVVAAVEKRKKAVPILYIVDSLDALSSRAELSKAIDQASFGAEKASVMSKLFRRINGALARADITFIIVSQLRDRIGVSYGAKQTRSGGKALNFYASQIVWLKKIGTVMQTVRGVKRPIALNIGAKVKKNKVGLSHRECEFRIYFGYGIDDLRASLDFLKVIKRDAQVYKGTKADVYLNWMNSKATVQQYAEQIQRVDEIIQREWWALEKEFMPTRKKYG